MSCSDHGFFGLLFSAILIVVSFIATLSTSLVLDQFHRGLLIEVPCNCIPVGINAPLAFSRSIVDLVVGRIKTSFLILLSVPESVAVRVVWLG